MRIPITVLLVIIAGCGTKTPLVKPAGPATPPFLGVPSAAPAAAPATAPVAAPAAEPRRDDSNAPGVTQ